MNLRNVILGVFTIVSFCVVLVLKVVMAKDLYVNIAGGAAFCSLVLWIALSWEAVSTFLTSKSARYGANLGFVLFLVVGILVFINILGREYHWTKDITRSRLNTLSEQSQKIVRELSVDVKAYYFEKFYEKDTGEDLLKRYGRLSRKFQFEFVDVDRFPTKVEAFGVKRKGTVVLSLPGTEKKMMVEKPTEEGITNALIKLLRYNQIAVYFTVGHGEHALSGDSESGSFSLFKNELEKQGYTTKELNLFNEGKVPADAAVLVVGGPKRAFFPKELEILSAWIRGGGRAVLAVDLDISENGLARGSAQIAELLKPYGVDVMSEMLVDPTSSVANVEPQVLLGFSGSREHAITKDFVNTKAMANFLFPLTTYLTRQSSSKYQITPLVRTSEKAWAESDWKELKTGRVTLKKGKDHQGQMDLAYAVEAGKDELKNAKQEGGFRLAVFANALFASNGLLDKVGNRDLILNTIAWLANDERFMSIRSRDDKDSLHHFNEGTLAMTLLFTTFVIPILVALTGTYIWWRRSKL